MFDLKKSTHESMDLKYAYDIVTNTNVVIFEWALDVNIPTIYVSDNVSQFGYTPEDFYSGDLKNFWNFLHPDDVDRVKSNLYKARTKGESYKHSYRILTKNGDVKWVEERIVYERDTPGTISHEKGILIDISEMKDLQEQLKSSEEKFKRLFQNSSVIILTTNDSGEITAINNMFSKTLGYTSEEVIQSKLQNYMLTPNDFLKLRENNAHDRDESLDVIFIKKNQEQVILSLSSTIINELLDVIEIVGIDVSEKKEDEQRIRYLSYHDKLTDVYNRAYFDEMFYKFDQEKKYPFSIIIGDMNGLKELNDNYGHKAGDKILINMAKIFKASCRDQDMVCRIGGDEFAIICPETDQVGAQSICQRIRNNCINDMNYLDDPPSVALGSATKVDDRLLIDDLFKQADDQMYKNKMTFKKSTSGMYISALQMMLEKNNIETKAHTHRMQNLAIEIGKAFDMTTDQIDDLNLVALMHDIGKIGIPDDILNKTTPLTQSEFQVVQGHSFIGYSILESVPATHKLANYILYHHENYDGSGYPEQLKGHEIPLISRIIRLIDAYDVMVFACVYKKNKTHKDAIKEIKKFSGIEFDPDVVNKFINYMNERQKND